MDGGESAQSALPWTAPRPLPLHTDVLYRLIFQTRFAVDLQHFLTFKRLMNRMLDIEMAWRPWFTIKGPVCSPATAADKTRDQPRVCKILAAHEEQGVAALQAFADDFSYMTPLQTLMLVSDAQACRCIDQLFQSRYM